jgi:hypothetical protein
MTTIGADPRYYDFLPQIEAHPRTASITRARTREPLRSHRRAVAHIHLEGGLEQAAARELALAARELALAAHELALAVRDRANRAGAVENEEIGLQRRKQRQKGVRKEKV